MSIEKVTTYWLSILIAAQCDYSAEKKSSLHDEFGKYLKIFIVHSQNFRIGKAVGLEVYWNGKKLQRMVKACVILHKHFPFCYEGYWKPEQWQLPVSKENITIYWASVENKASWEEFIAFINVSIFQFPFLPLEEHNNFQTILIMRKRFLRQC